MALAVFASLKQTDATWYSSFFELVNKGSKIDTQTSSYVTNDGYNQVIRLSEIVGKEIPAVRTFTIG